MLEEVRVLLSLGSLRGNIPQAAPRIVLCQSQADGSAKYLIDPGAAFFGDVVGVTDLNAGLQVGAFGAGDVVERFSPSAGSMSLSR